MIHITFRTLNAQIIWGTSWPVQQHCHVYNICCSSQPLLSSPSSARLHLLNFSLSSFSAIPPPPPKDHRLPPSQSISRSLARSLPSSSFISLPLSFSPSSHLQPSGASPPAFIHFLHLLSVHRLVFFFSLFSLLRCSPTRCSLHSLRNQDQSGRRLTLRLEVRLYVCVCVCGGGDEMHYLSTLEGRLHEWITEKGEMMSP